MIAKQIAARLKSVDNIIVASHYNPEGDAIGSILALTLALKSLGKRVHAYNQDGLPFNLMFLPEAGLIKTELPSWNPDAVVVADCAELHRAGEAAKEKFTKAPLLVNIDHHETNPAFGHLNWIKPDSASASEMIAELLDELGMKWTPQMAEAIYTGIVADTGSFQFGNTNPETFRAAAKMVERGANPGKVAQYLYFDWPDKVLKLLCMVLATLKIEEGGKIATVAVTKAMFDETGTTSDATEGFVDYPRSIRGVEVAALFRQTGDAEFKISLRSKGNMDVAKIAKTFGGGGHSAAAGCIIKGSLEEVRKSLLDAISRSMLEAQRG